MTYKLPLIMHCILDKTLYQNADQASLCNVFRWTFLLNRMLTNIDPILGHLLVNRYIRYVFRTQNT